MINDGRSLKIVDAGDIDEALPLESAHQNLTQLVSTHLQLASIPFVVGGGNDQSYANASALLQLAVDHKKSIMVINIDAHLDVRPLKKGQVHSGSPFRLMLEDPRWKQCGGAFVEFASQGSQCALEHVKYVKDQGGQIFWLSQMQENAVATFQQLLTQTPRDWIFVSFDLDAVRGSDAPVCSIKYIMH